MIVWQLQLQKQALLEAVSYTANGKEATPEKQASVLQLVQGLESSQPAPAELLSDPALAKKLLDGVWYLQYTSPSQIGDADQFPEAWKPKAASEGDVKIPTKKFDAKGSVSAAGIKVDTSNRLVQQIFDIDGARVTNNIVLDWGNVKVSGTFRQSPNVANRALVAFDTAEISLGDSGPSVNFGGVFSILAFFRGGERDNGWLETTFIDESLRIGRGNKGVS